MDSTVADTKYQSCQVKGQPHTANSAETGSREWYRNHLTGSGCEVLVDSHQDVARLAQDSLHKSKFKVVTMPADYAWLTPQGDKLVLVEEKKPYDLQSSLSNRRLQRQLRANLAVADIAVLALRLQEEIEWGSSQDYIFSGDLEQVNKELLQLAMWEQHGLTVFLPEIGVLDHLLQLRKILGMPEESRGILAGSDKKRVKDDIPFQRAVRRLVDGVGPTTARKLDKAFKGDLVKFITAHDEMLSLSGLHRGQIRKLREYVPA